MLPGFTRTGLEVDVRDHRDLRLPRDRRQRVRVVLRRTRHPHDLTARRRQLRDLLQRGTDVGRPGRRHRLHGDGRVPADRHGSDLDLPALAAFGEFGRNGRHAERNRSHLLCNPKSWITKVRIRVGAGPVLSVPGRSHPIRYGPFRSRSDGIQTPRLRHARAREHISVGKPTLRMAAGHQECPAVPPSGPPALADA
ncbi:hypothetical protein GCM10018782_21890 [Streptomyces griseoaurantiacus]|nr:hypothetical protein GCM10018782_21890 [Streptomyces griseoaurantiacus]